MIESSRTLEEELTGLSAECSRLGADLLDAGRALADPGAPPAQGLVDRIAVIRGAFVALRSRLLEHAASLDLAFDGEPEAVVSLSELETFLEGLVGAEVAEARDATREASEAAEVDEAEAPPRREAVEAVAPEPRTPRPNADAMVQQATAVLDRVLLLAHDDDRAFAPLQDVQAKARELRAQISRAASDDPARAVELLNRALRPFVCLVGMVMNRDTLDEERWAELEDAVAEAFGRSLALAATRGRLVVAGAQRRTPSPPARAAAAPPPAPAVSSAGPRPAPASTPARESLRPSILGPTSPPPSAELDPRLASIGWWATVYRAWAAWRASGMAYAHAIRNELARHPHLLSVPIRQSLDFGEGVAAGYYLLLEHVDKRGAGFRRALEGLAAEGGSQGLERRVYEILVTEGRLRDTYADFLSEIIVVVVPNQPLWADAGLVESSEATVLMTRGGARPGDAAESTQRLTEAKARAAGHHFSLSLAPLTTRFFYVRAGELKEGRDIHVDLKENGEPSDRAWLLVLRTTSAQRPRRHAKEGTALPGLGRDYTSLWVAVFNPEPDGARQFDLTLTVRAHGPTASRASTFKR